MHNFQNYFATSFELLWLTGVAHDHGMTTMIRQLKIPGAFTSAMSPSSFPLNLLKSNPHNTAEMPVFP